MLNTKNLNRFNFLLGETEAAYHDVSVKLGLSDSAMKILYTICDNGSSCLLKDIIRRSGLNKQTVNSALRKLEADGIIFLEKVGAKSKNVCLTGQGEKLSADTAMRILEIENSIFDSWDHSDVDTYLRLTEKFLIDFKERTASI
jgi:DNA-binding MarR family transcriptional regulator